MSDINVILNESTTYQLGYAPLTVTLNPSGYQVNDSPIVKIEYDFKDGTSPTVVKRTLLTSSS